MLFAYIYAENGGIVHYLVEKTQKDIEATVIATLKTFLPAGTSHQDSKEYQNFELALAKNDLPSAMEAWNQFVRQYLHSRVSCHQIRELDVG